MPSICRLSLVGRKELLEKVVHHFAWMRGEYVDVDWINDHLVITYADGGDLSWRPLAVSSAFPELYIELWADWEWTHYVGLAIQAGRIVFESTWEHRDGDPDYEVFHGWDSIERHEFLADMEYSVAGYERFFADVAARKKWLAAMPELVHDILVEHQQYRDAIKRRITELVSRHS